MNRSQQRNREYWKTHDPYFDQSQKQCAKCGKLFSRTNFRCTKTEKDGLGHNCKSCIRKNRKSIATARQNIDPYINLSLKECIQCHKMLRRIYFTINRHYRDVLNSTCKHCCNNNVRECRSQSKEHWSIRNPYSDPTLKRCPQCKIDKQRIDFARCSNNSDGLEYRCKQCMAIIRLKKRLDNTMGYLYNLAKMRAKRKGLTFTILKSDIVIPENCPILGIPIDNAARGRASYNSPSIDRIDNARGYEPSNVHVISHRANSLKSNATLKELKAIVAFLEL